MTQHGTPAGSSNALVYSGAGVILGLFAAGVALALAGWKPESIVGLLTGLGTVAGVLLAAMQRMTKIDTQMQQVAKQTDGDLREHISQSVATEVRAALTDAGHPPVTRGPAPPHMRGTRP